MAADPSTESFWSSKTMCMLAFCIGAIILLIAIGVLVKVAFDTDVFTLVGAGIAAITGQAGAGTWRNVAVDGEQRKMITQASVTAPVGTLEPTVPIGSDPAASNGTPAVNYGAPPVTPP